MTNQEISAFMREMGRKGGLRRRETLTQEERSAIARKAARARWARHTVARDRPQWSRATWPPGQRFDYVWPDIPPWRACILGRYTAKTAYWLWPDFDDDLGMYSRYSRRMTIAEFERLIRERIIVKAAP